MRQLILGTAGHIDHGKTALVRALTGTDTDRLPEEKRRGITIDLGFASLVLDDGTRLGIVDVPGHEAFVRNMLAGATGIDLMLLVVAADEGVMPQTREHLAIIELLGIRRGVVAITKTDVVDAEWLELVHEDVRKLVAETPLAGVRVVEVSARTGAGLDDLRAALAAAAADAELRRSDDLFRMPIDRVFTVRGTGTVATGTVWTGSLARDAQLRIEPAGVAARVRGLQTHGAECAEVRAGERAAIALAGVDRARIGRGDSLLLGAGWQTASMLTVEFTVLPAADAPLRPRQRVRVHLGTAEVLARLALPDGDVAPGGTALGQLRLETPLVARTGDRLVIRSYSPVHTIAGARVLEPSPPKRKRLSTETREALRALSSPGAALGAALALADAAGSRLADLPVLTGLPPAVLEAQLAADPTWLRIGDRVTAASHVEECRLSILDTLRAFHAAAPLHDGMEREALRRAAAPAVPAPLFEAAMSRLVGERIVATREAAVALAAHSATPSPAQAEALVRLAAVYRAAGLQAPDLAELPADLFSRDDLPLLLRQLERDGCLVRLATTRWIDAAAVSSATHAVLSQLPGDTELGVADFRDHLNLTRKHLIPLLEYFDRLGVTVREGDVRRLQTGTPRVMDPRRSPC
jgi:selenocysteine-specific elongation factor